MRNKKLSYAELAVFSRQLALVVNSDISMQEGLGLIREQSLSREFVPLLNRLTEKINRGIPLSRAMREEKDILPKFYIDMIRIGEQSGNLEKVLIEIADAYEKDIKTAKKVRAAFTYPAILAVLMLGVVLVLIIEVVPLFDDILTSLGGGVPGLTRAIMDIGLFLKDNIWIILGVVIALAGAVLIAKRTEKGRGFFDRIKLKMPLKKDIVLSVAAVRFARNMAMLLKSGINEAQSIGMLMPVIDNRVIRARMRTAAERIKKGETIQLAFVGLKLFPDLLVRLLTVAQGTGHMDDMLNKAADVMDETLDDKLGRLTSVLEPSLIIVLALIVGVILVSVIIPVIDIMNAIG